MPEEVFIEYGQVPPTANSNAEIFDSGSPPRAHATQVAGVMISQDPVAPGVAQDALLFASAGDVTTTPFVPLFDKLAASAQHVAIQNGDDVRAINLCHSRPVMLPMAILS
jgi:hypothetical protein